MAGLGETCTHIAAVLFYLEVNTWIDMVINSQYPFMAVSPRWYD